MSNRPGEGWATNRSIGAAILRYRYRIGARYAAMRDLRSGALIDIEPTSDGRLTGRTSYIDEMQHAARRASSQVMAALWRDNARLVKEIHTRAAAVVHHHDVLGNHETVHHKRLRANIATWCAATQVAALRADAIVASFNQIVYVYWRRLSGRHPQLQAGTHRAESDGPRPVAIVRDTRWLHPIELIPPMPPPQKHSTSPPTALDRAIRIVAVAAAS